SSIPDPRARVLLGEHSLEGRPLPWRLALYWYLSSEQKRLRTPAYRCWEHLVRLFERRYGEHFGEGMIVPPNRSRLRLTYTPASPGLGGLGASMQLPIGELPDLMRLRRPVDTLGVLVESCMQELDAYSRWVGREGNEPGSLEAVALLPAALVGEAQSRECDAIRAELEPLLRATEPSARAMAALDASTLFRHWKTAKEGLMSKREASTLMALLARLGFGIEPDPRFGGARIRADMQLVLFRQAPNAITSAPSSEYASARLVLQIAALVANADGSTEASEQLALERHLEDSLDLSAGEKLRLAAHLRWLQSSGAKLTGLKKQLAGLDANTREAIASFAVTIANADGRIDPKEVALLRRVYAMLELDPEEVYEAVHRATIAPALAPVAVRAAGPRRLGHRIPAPAPDASGRRPEAEAGAASAPVIDRAKVQKKIQETARVSALLAGIFDSEQEPEGADLEEEAPPQTLTPNAGGAAAIDRPPPAESGVAGLEPEQEAFLRALEARNQWEREAIEALAEAHGVLLEGTLDAINDLSFERIDEPAIEWDEPLEINRRALRELLG
ncbi:MAG: TerB family tellurite resistance protein, partial [Myxococcales bacterium]|nr:TerB family tellurite resistance protein [Myxococcales bacterium]